MRTKVIPEALIKQILSEKFKKRFWSHVKIGSRKECWPWTAYTKEEGYGQITIQTLFCPMRTFYAHRIAWIITSGRDAPSGLFVLHSCVSSPSCCNPHHLRIGTHDDNMKDKCEQGHQYNGGSGETHAFAKLNNEKVRYIRNAYSCGEVTQKELGKKFGVHQVTIGLVVSRKTWTHI